jgi:hypothetical protein
MAQTPLRASFFNDQLVVGDDPTGNRLTLIHAHGRCTPEFKSSA